MATTGGPDEIANQVQALRDALGESRHVLEHVCRYHDDWLDEELREIVQQACGEVDQLWDPAINAITSNRSGDLERAGLLGAQGDAKVRGIRKWAKEFFRSPTKRAFMKAAKWINIVLGSLASILPGGEALREFKELIEAAVAEE